MTRSTETVSIIMPVKNAGSYLHDCLSSIRGQTFSLWQLIAIDDHSTDQSKEILEAAAARDGRISIYKNQSKGIIPALQQALAACNGTYLTRMDADDVMPENRLELMVAAMQQADPKTIVTGIVKYISSQPVSAGYQNYEAWLNDRIEQDDHWKWAYRECVIASPNWMVRLAEIKEVGGFDKLSYPEDYDLVLQWYSHGFLVKGIDQVTLLWREHPDRTSRNSEHYDQEHFFRLKVRHFLAHDLKQEQLVLWGTGPKGKLTARILDKSAVKFQWMDRLNDGAVRQQGKHQILPSSEIERLNNVKLLIAVYPPMKEKLKLEAYLANLGLQMGIDFWYL